MKVTRQIVGNLDNTYGDGNGRDYITIHETANTDEGADAQAHANLQSNGNARDASWHYSVDDHSAFQSYEDTIQCWHAGDGQGNGNLNSIAIEICVNKGASFSAACQNAASLTADLLKKYDLDISRVVQHNKWSGKDCPNWLREGDHWVTWDEFLDMVRAELGDDSGEPAPTPKPPASGALTVDGRWGKATTRELQEYFGTPADGEVWSQNIEFKDDNPGLTEGWKWEKWTSGIDGSPVIRELQEYLKSKGLYKDKVDGLIGPNTIKGLQKHFGTEVDGELWLDSPCIKALQSRLNKIAKSGGAL
jgi:N-acetylmuramoyl-L-alanine amidase